MTVVDAREPRALTHAGAVVWWAGPHEPLFLLITAKGAPDEFVLPKGRIERGESPEGAAAREVKEETGLEVTVGAPLGTETFLAKGSRVVCAYFLARHDPRRGSTDAALADEANAPAGLVPAAEGRLAVWLPLARAMQRSTFPACRHTLERAGALLGNGM